MEKESKERINYMEGKERINGKKMKKKGWEGRALGKASK